MKKRRTLIISLLLIAAIALGIGYAAQTGSVTVAGSVSNQPHPVKLVFVNNGSQIVNSQITLQDGTTATSSVHEFTVVDGSQEATFSISDLSHVGDYITADFVVKNTNEYNVTLREDADGLDGANVSITKLGDNAANTPDFFTVTAEWVRTEGDSLTLAHNETKMLRVTITLTEATAELYSGRYALTVYGDSAE